MDVTQLQSIRDRVANATGPDREIDYAIYTYSTGLWRTDDFPAVTSSIDAALALVERVLPGWEWSVWASGGVFGATIYNTPEDEIEPCVSAQAPTAPLAILKAFVAALIAQENANEQA
jgi:hypothetical protein